MKNVLFLILASFLMSCDSSQEVGQVNVQGSKEFSFQISILDGFKGSFIMYEVKSRTHGIISDKDYLIDITDEVSIDDFYSYASSHIIYLCYRDSNVVYAIFDTKAKNGFPLSNDNDTFESKHLRGDSLFNIIKQNNELLTKSTNFDWYGS